MKLFDDTIRKIHTWAQQGQKTGTAVKRSARDVPLWPAAGSRDIVLARDTGLELGGPRAESFFLLVWTNDPTLVDDGAITRIGPGTAKDAAGTLPFGSVLVIGGTDFDETNSYQRFVEMSLLPYEISLKGYMARAAFQDMRQWARISRRALENGFCVDTVGRAITEACRRKAYVAVAELLTVTAADADVEALRSLCREAVSYINAMRKMAEKMNFDCSTCEYQGVCSEVSELRAMAETLEKQRGKKVAGNG